ncbi:hypothetical protein ACRC3P_004690 [Escherichia coli]|uniref:hypothetical protein n=2 Tax=Escherichia coli TaxID=562 RepID=UPI0007A0055D|nr:hypothetical protein [Escherichia coli]EEY4479619.1 hypothetical protein [Escherichia coli O8]EFP8751292.1 hypothetical protein [Shigella flexneri]ELP2957441.1 hypothetical protein [Escherichia coli O168]EEC9337147.1 hypothetical protein [Escherichia coli]EEQ2305034.1 hypothetical protein [Escherichia coli]
MDGPHKGERYLPGRILMKSFEKLREALSENGLYAVRIENGEIIYTTVIPEDHIILSVEAFIEYIERIGFKVIRD